MPACLLNRLACALLASTLWAQTTGSLEGTAYDPSGVVTPGCVLHILQTSTGAERRVQTDERGRYLAASLAPGNYRVEISHPGFKTQVREGIPVPAGRTVRADFALELGESRESMVVVGEPPLVSTSSSDWGGSVQQQKLESLPLRGRDIFDLIAQQPGASIPSNITRALFQGYGIHLSVNGARPWQNSFRLDGVYINDSTGSAPSSASGRLVGLETLEEVHLITSPFSAEYGRTAGAVFTAVSKSGANDLHGSLYEYLRNDAFDSKNYFDPVDERVPPLRKNQFGALLSGPLRRNRLFLLGNYEGIRDCSGSTAKPVTLSADARRGILSPGSAPISVAPSVRPYLDLYPLPNGRDFGDGTGEYITTVLTRGHEDYSATKADWLATERLRVSARYTFDAGHLDLPDPYHIWTFTTDSRYHLLHFDTQFVQSPTTLYHFRAGFSRVWNFENDHIREDIPPSLAFLPGQPLGTLRVVGLDDLGGGGRTANVQSRPRRYVLNDFQFNQEETLIRGAHAMVLGSGYDRIQHNQVADVSAAGLYRFNSITDFLQAHPRAGDLMYPGSDSIRGFRQHQVFAFAQDEWRATHRLSLTLGVRYETYTTPTEVNGKIATFRDPWSDPQTTVGGPLFENPSRKNFAPRGALAWDVFGAGKTVVRAGSGIFFDLIGSRELLAAGNRMPPFFVRAAPANPPFPNLLDAVTGAPPQVATDGLDYFLQQPYAAQFQFRLQQQIGSDTVFELGYSGSRGVHLIGDLGNINTTRPQYLADGRLFFPANAPRMNPAFQQIGIRRSAFDSSYHALLVSAQRRWRRGIQFQVKYGWGKSLDDNSVTIVNDYVSSNGVPTVFNYSQNRGPSDYDLRHDFAANFSWQAPGPRSGWRKTLFAGWEIHGLFQAHSGQPFSPQVGFDRARLLPSSNDQGQRPDSLGVPADQVILGQVDQYFDPLAFALPAAGFLGNVGRNTLTGPGVVALDAALQKHLWQTDRQSVRLRLEAFNATNRPNFSIPSNLALFDSTGARLGAAGRITTTSTTARQMQLALKWTF